MHVDHELLIATAEGVQHLLRLQHGSEAQRLADAIERLLTPARAAGSESPTAFDSRAHDLDSAYHRHGRHRLWGP